MKIIEVPLLNEDGSVQVTHVLTASEVQVLLQFALNFLASAGLSVRMIVDASEKDATPEAHDITIQ